MMHPRLQNQFGQMEILYRRARLLRRLTICWLIIAGAELLLFLLHNLLGLHTQPFWWLVLIGGLLAAGLVWMRERQRPSDLKKVIAFIESENPGLRHFLSTAAEQTPAPDAAEFGFLQLRLIDQVLRHGHRFLWRRAFEEKLSSARLKQIGALAVLFLVLCLGSGSRRWHFIPRLETQKEIVVSPGDTQLERGTGLVISARFGGKPPSEATLVLLAADGKTKRIPLERHLADPVFGASLLEVTQDSLYHVEYGDKKTRDFKINVFDFPALRRADADLRYPDYTGLTNATIRDTRRITAVEGTRLTYTLQLNKPVTRASFIGKEQTLALTTTTNGIGLLDNFTLTNSAHYELELVDADGRTNKVPTEFVIQVLPDRPPEMKIAFPRGDQRVSRLEELQLQGEAHDDFGLLKYGIGFSIAGEPPQFIELGQSAAGNEKRQFTNQVALEKLGVEVDQLVSYFAWADDYGPDGQVRRNFSDMFFAEVRPFEEIFRPDQSGGGNEGGQQQGGNQGNQAPRLAELQKQIVLATWKLQRDKQSAASASKK